MTQESSEAQSDDCRRISWRLIAALKNALPSIPARVRTELIAEMVRAEEELERIGLGKEGSGVDDQGRGPAVP